MKFLILFSCVAAAFASQLCGENQHHEDCGTACPLTCRNHLNPPKFCVLSCNIGCHCDKGYVKADDGRCVRPEECPSQAQEVCGANEVYNECGTACPLTCDNYQDPPLACVKMCKIGCECAKGFVRADDGKCVRPSQCRATEVQTCLGEAEPGMCRGAFPMWYYNAKTQKCHEFIYGGCGGNGNRYATKEECMGKCSAGKVDVGVCALPAVTGPCRARLPQFFFNQASGKCEQFIYGGCRGNGNRFGTIEECHNTCAQQASQQCAANEHYDSCGTHCPTTCDNMNNPPRGCILSCNAGCHCNKGYFRNAAGQCVKPENCENKAAEVCSLPTETGPCKARVIRYHFDQTTGNCHEFVYGGCGGNENNFKTLESCEGSCKKQGNNVCTAANEHFEECGTACPLTCDNHNDPPTACVLSCNTGCHCDKGYVRNAHGQCVKPSACPSFGQEWRPDCDKKGESGPCLAYIERFYYDQEEGMCKKFIYGGCGGNRNNFQTEFDCLNHCGAL